MVPYRGRLALRIARVALALGLFGWYPFTPGARISWKLAVLAAYALFAVGTLFEERFDSASRAILALVVDSAFFGFYVWLLPWGLTSTLVCGYLLASVAVLQPLTRVAITAAAVIAMVRLFSTPPGGTPLSVAVASGGLAIAFAAHKQYLERRLSHTLRHNVIIRSQAQGAREAERERIAADFHDGPLQSFISFQMRLEILKKLLERDAHAAAVELRQLQDL